MACGEDYVHLLTNSLGSTPEEPCTGWWCNEPDVTSWSAQVDVVFDLQRTAWNKLRTLEEKAGDHALSEDLRDQVELYERGYDSLPDPSGWMVFGAAGALEAATKMSQNVVAGACVLDLLNQSIEQSGGTAIEAGIKKKPASKWWWVLGIGAGVLLVGGGGVATYYILRKDDDGDQAANGKPGGNGKPAANGKDKKLRRG